MELPNEIICDIALYLPARDMLNLGETNHGLAYIIHNDDYIWRQRYRLEHPEMQIDTSEWRKVYSRMYRNPEWYIVNGSRVQPYQPSHAEEVLMSNEKDVDIRQVLCTPLYTYMLDGSGRVWQFNSYGLSKVDYWKDIVQIEYIEDNLWVLDRHGVVSREMSHEPIVMGDDIVKISFHKTGIYYIYRDGTVVMSGSCFEINTRVKDIYSKFDAVMYIDMADTLWLIMDGRPTSIRVHTGARKMVCSGPFYTWIDMEHNLWTLHEEDGITKREDMKAIDLNIDHFGNLLVKGWYLF